MAEQDPTALIQRLVDDNRPWFEGCLIGYLALSRAYFDKVKSVLCVDKDSGEFYPDFSTDIDNAIYQAICSFYNAMQKADSVNKELFRVYLEQIAGEGTWIGMGEVDAAFRRVVEFTEVPVDQLETLMDNGYTYWLKRRRTEDVIRRSALSNLLPEQLAEEVRAHVKIIERQKESDTYEFGHGTLYPQPEVFRIGTGLSDLDICIGGGLGQGEGTLFIGAQGSGKTIIACQIAANIAAHSKHVLFITTEQRHRDLELRIISNRCNVPFDRIKDNFRPDRDLSSVEFEKYCVLVEQLRDYLHFKDWMEDRARSVITDLDTELDKVEDKYGKVDCIILDWIGGALGSESVKNPEAIRHIYQATADKMASIASDRNMVSVSFAQAAMGLCYNKKRIDATMLAECKNMGRNMTNVIGISALTEKESDDKEAIYLVNQIFWVSKARKGENKQIKFKREYRYQRVKCEKD
jgi:replicative DNA helicase